LAKSATYISVEDRINIEDGNVNVAEVNGGPFVSPYNPLPAKRVTNPEESIFFI
jgi:hypothetical protein